MSSDIELLNAKVKQLETDIVDARNRIGVAEREAQEASEKKRYNGHANYETWLVDMYVDGNYDGEGTYHHYQELALEACRENTDAEGILDRDGAIGELSTRLRDELRDGESRPDLGATIWADLLGAALDEVAWYDIAEGLVDTAIESDYTTCDACSETIQNDETCPCQHDVHHYVSIRVKLEDSNITDHEVIRHGRMAADYFLGCGLVTSHYTHIATGCGSDDDEALEDALEQLAEQDVDTSSLPY